MGAMLRFYLSTKINALALSLPLGTISVNLLGSLIMGFLFAYFKTETISENVKFFLTTGLLGALTTYSTFALETWFLAKTSLFLALANCTVNLIGTILMVGLGIWLHENLNWF